MLRLVTAVRSFRSFADRVGSVRHIAAEQILVTTAQLTSGIGNFAFAVIMVRVLEPPDFAILRAFLALYLVVNVPAGSMSAGTALDPDMAVSARTRVRNVGLGVAAAMIIAAAPLGVFLEIPIPLIVALAVSLPAISSRALLRGRLWAVGGYRRGAISLVLDVIVRIGLGTGMALLLGPLGAAIGVVAGGYASLLVVSDKNLPMAKAEPKASTSAGWWTTAAFILVAVVLNQDLLLANKLLPAMEAARFAGISTLGGMAAFATMAIPWLLLPRIARGDRGALPVSLGLAALLGGGMVAISALWPSGIVSIVLGAEYSSIAPLLVPYMLAMALFGIGRVLVAHRCATGGAGKSIWILAAVAVAQAIGIAAIADSAGEIVAISLAANAGFCVLMAVRHEAVVVPLRSSARYVADRVSNINNLLVGGAILAVAVGLRLIVVRGLWVDEAITVARARMGFSEMLEVLRVTDVHPPGHYAMTWGVIRILGSSEFSVRLVSLVAGILLVAILYALGRELFDRRTGVVAATLGAVAPLLIWYSQEARMYSVVMLFSATAVWAQVRAVRTGAWWTWALYTVATAAMLWTHYFSLLQVAVQQIAFLVFAWKRRGTGQSAWKLTAAWLASAVVIGALVAPLESFAEDQFTANRARNVDRGIPSQTGSSAGNDYLSIYTVLANGVWGLFGYHSDHMMSQIVALWPLGMVLAFLLLGRGRIAPNTSIVAAAAFVPIAGLFAAGFVSRNLFEVRYFASAIPLLVLLGARVLTKVASRPAMFRAVFGGVVALLLVAGADQQLNGTNPRIYDFRGALSQIEARATERDLLLYEPQFLEYIVDYYVPGMESRLAAGGVPEPRPGRRVFLLGSFLDKPGVAGRTGDILSALERDHVLVDRFKRPQVGVWMFEPASDGERGGRAERERGRERREKASGSERGERASTPSTGAQRPGRSDDEWNAETRGWR